jgi:tRNA (uracil-5-)-methyltransferase TRM9
MLVRMKRETVLALSALNHAFYEAIAPEWSESRRHAWPGFSRVLQLCASAPLRVLDVGAGDGRFAAFLHAQPALKVAYLGVDASERLLATARARALGPEVRFERADFIADEAALPEGSWSLVVLLGVLHHVPSFELRARLLRQLAQRTAAGGLLAVTFWRLDRDPRFAQRVRSWSHAAQPIDEADLEPGDTLLGWGAAERAVRYCHFPDARETEALIAAAGLPVVARFEADGRGDALNEYVVFSRRQA